MSVWHTPQAARRTSTSPARGSARSTSAIFSGWPNSSSTAARIFTAALLSVGRRWPPQPYSSPSRAAAEPGRRRPRRGAAGRRRTSASRRGVARRRPPGRPGAGSRMRARQPGGAGGRGGRGGLCPGRRRDGAGAGSLTASASVCGAPAATRRRGGGGAGCAGGGSPRPRRAEPRARRPSAGHGRGAPMAAGGAGGPPTETDVAARCLGVVAGRAGCGWSADGAPSAVDAATGVHARRPRRDRRSVDAWRVAPAARWLCSTAAHAAGAERGRGDQRGADLGGGQAPVRQRRRSGRPAPPLESPAQQRRPG